MKKRLKAVSIIVILTMLFPFASFAADEAKDPNAGLVNHVINLEGQSKMTVYDLMLFPTTQGNQLVFKADIYNASNNELSFNYYWLRVLTKQGTRHNVTLINNDQGTTVPPRTTRTFIFTSQVGDQVKLSDISLQAIRWNFSVAGYEQHLGTVSVTEQYDPTVSWTAGKRITIDNSPILFTGESYQAVALDKEYRLKIDLKARNNGKFSVKIPAYTYYVQTANGLLYPAEQTEADVSVLPNSDNTIKLQATVPNTVDPKNLNLVIVTKTDQLVLPQIIMKLPKEFTEIIEEDVVEYERYEYRTDDGVYTVILKNLQRLPNNETDIISVEVELANLVNESALPNIELTATMELDKIQLKPAEIEGVRIDNNLNIKKGKSVTFIFNTEIPYNFEFDDFLIQLKEKRGNESVPIVKFANTSDQFSLEYADVINTNTTGKMSKVQVVDYHKYNASENDILYTSVVMTNMEPRFATLEQLVGFYKINGNIYFPAEIVDNKVLTMPSGKSLIPVTTEIPKDFEVESVELVLGTQLSDKESYKQAYLLRVPKDVEEVKEEFQDLKVANYTLSMDDVRLYINNGAASLNFEYELSRVVYQHELANHKMRFVIVAADKRFEADIVLGKDMKVGSGKYELPIPGDVRTAVGTNGYHIEIYDVFGDASRQLLKSKKIFSWYSNTPLPTY